MTPASAVAAANLSAASDAELAERIVAGDVGAFELLMRRHNRTLFRTARAILRDDAEAEDAVQEAYLHAHRALATFRGDARLSTWLVRIVANEALGRLRKRTRRADVLPLSPVEEIPAMRTEDGPESAAQRAAMRRLLEKRIDALPETYRAVFVLRALEELSVEETAAALGIAQATVRTRFFRARSQLREALSREIDLAYDDAFSFAGERCDRVVARVLAGLSADAIATK